MPSLTVHEASTRARSVVVTSYDVELDLTRGDQQFGSKTCIEFRSLDRQATFVDLQPAELIGGRLNQQTLDVTELRDGRLHLTDLRDENVLTVESLMSYSHDGEGLHRAVDPQDKQAYVYAMCFLPAAPRIFACFDQPDLKAPYTMKVIAPSDWTVLGNGVAKETAPGHWELAQTKPLATYFVTLVAGPYHSLSSEHDGITLGLHCRQSLAPHLDKDAEELFRVSGQCFDEFHRLFGIRYPFGDYHQAFVPEFNAGAMENPGCVTFSDDLVFKAQATESRRARRANVVAHEMAHQWFGDLVTMRWWDDLWLNESFAEYMGYRVTSEVTEFDDVWLEYTYDTKAWGLAADQRSSTHPIAGNGARDAEQALTDFDGISYSKGASALRQLNAYLGDDAFIGGVATYLRDYAYGNASLDDLLSAWSKTSGKDVDEWAAAWLRTSGVDRLSCATGDAGRPVIQRDNGSPEDVSRPHAITVSWYGGDGHSESTPLVVDRPQTPLELPAYDGSGLVLPDSADQTWAKIGLDESSLADLRHVFERIDDASARAVVWGALREGMLDGSLDPDRYLTAIEHSLSHDVDVAVEATLGADSSRGAIPRIGTYFADPSARDRLAGVAEGILRDAEPGSNRQLIATRALLEVTRDTAMVRTWLSGACPDGLLPDEDFRWRAVRMLCAAGEFGEPEIAAELDRDPSSQGLLHSLECRAVLPEPKTKAAVWSAIVTDASLSNYELYAMGGYFFRPDQLELTAPYVPRYFVDIPATASIRHGWVVERLADLVYPMYAVDPSTVRLAEECLARGDLTPGVRRSISDHTDDLRRALASRERYAR
jgi:aminopeptidase N